MTLLLFTCSSRQHRTLNQSAVSGLQHEKHMVVSFEMKVIKQFFDFCKKFTGHHKNLHTFTWKHKTTAFVLEFHSLTLWEPGYDIFVLRFRLKKQQFLVALPTP